MTFMVKDSGASVLTLGGRSWQTKYIDWPNRKAYVEPTELKGRSQWLSTGQPIHLDLCQAIAQILYSETVPVSLSKRAQELLSAVRDDFSWIEADKTTLIVDGNGNAIWWIFAGKLFNSAMAESLASECEKIATDNLGITFTKVIDNDELFKKIRMVLSGSEDDVLVSLGQTL